MRTIRLSLCVIFLFCLAYSPAVAQNAPPRLEFFAEFGGSYLTTGLGQATFITTCPTCAVPAHGAAAPIVPVSSSFPVPLSSSVSTAGRLFTGGRIRLTRHDAIELSYSFSPNHFKYLAESQVAGSGYTRLDLSSLNYARYLWVRTRLQPFVTAGVGLNRFRGGPGTVPPPIEPGQLPGGGELSFNNPVSNGRQFAWNYGGGADLVLQRHFALRVELRDYVAGQPIPLTGTSYNLVPSAGLVFRFD